jgi:rhodanese-related sulfurtransferase
MLRKHSVRKASPWFAVLVLIAVLVFMLEACASTGASQGLPAEISVAQAYEQYGKPSVFFLDVREQDEWDAVHIPNTTLIPLGQLTDRISEIPADQQIVVVCRSGNRSRQGRDILKQAGLQNVTSMNGGVNGWQAAGYPVEP